MRYLCREPLNQALHSVHFLQVFETEREVQMVLELMEGADLFDRIINKTKDGVATGK